MKWLTIFVFIGLLFVGQASRVEASEGVKTNLQMANEDIETIDKIGKISDPKVQARAIAEFMRKVQGFGDPVRVEAAKNGLNKYAFNMHDGKWAVIYESKKGLNGASSGYIMAGENPPSDAEILPTKTIEGVKK
ncbi:MAG TPA: hypothetical protein VMQ48_00730 [Candidatus Saccharimonadales bacterium]|nr:hypothetical protein [Candidatus Saccharimonadales bacterium]